MTIDENEIIQGLKVICKCKAVRYKTIKAAIVNGAHTLEMIRKKTGANTGCGKQCTAQINAMIKKHAKPQQF